MCVTILSVMTTVTAPARRRTSALVVALLALLAVALVAIAVLVIRGRGDDTPTPATSSTAPAAAIAAIVDGRDYFVGTNLDPGAYRQASDTPDCRWSVTDPITGDVIEQGTPGTGPATVNLGKDTRFRADGCGPWVAAG